MATPADLVNPLMGTQSSYALSTGNTYPSVSMPWGMNAWSAQTGKMGDGWMYSYNAEKIRGFKQTHQPSPWINDYGCFSIMPVAGKLRWDEDSRASWFSHKAEKANPYSYSVYLADLHTELSMAPTERDAVFCLHYKGADSAWLVIDGIDKGAYVKLIPAEYKVIGYTLYNSGRIPENFKNYFDFKFSRSFTTARTFRSKQIAGDTLELEAAHAGAVLGFGAQVGGMSLKIWVASSFISFEQYAHGNQPIQHMPYLYKYSSKPHKTEYWVREIMNRLYSATPDGYCGDEDNGQTSAWYVFSAMGFYPVCPGSDQYVTGSPMFKKMTVKLENGKVLVIEAAGNSSSNRYVQGLSVFGKKADRYLAHSELMQGGLIKFIMGGKPATAGSSTQLPFSLSAVK